MKKTSIMIIATLFLVAVAPKKSEAGVLEGALIGAAIGAVIGIIIHLMKQKDDKEAEQEEHQEQSYKFENEVMYISA